MATHFPESTDTHVELELPPLPYPYEALEPHIDRVTMTLHHDKHHATYVSNLKKALEERPPTQRAVATKKADPIKKAVANRNGLPVHWEALLTGISRGRTVMECCANHTIFMQGAPADAMFFILRGKVKLTVSSHDGKEAIVATLGAGEFLGEGCLAGQPLRTATAVSVGDCTLARVEKSMMARLLHEEQGLAEMFVTQLLVRNIRHEADLVDQLFNSSEKRLARMLLLLSHFGKESTTETVVAGVNQENLAQMVGTTRSRVNMFMNKFRDRGFIDYNGDAGVTVHRGLLSVVLHD